MWVEQGSCINYLNDVVRLCNSPSIDPMLCLEEHVIGDSVRPLILLEVYDSAIGGQYHLHPGLANSGAADELSWFDHNNTAGHLCSLRCGSSMAMNICAILLSYARATHFPHVEMYHADIALMREPRTVSFVLS
ncbi:hypothetical protein VNO77_26904 [Canavalia gladiata]|uniref:Uncharacterized protein n=1 Tax=Canavalia gladiata TaxID=3824 RepID=A0AAN9Q605_CANGL